MKYYIITVVVTSEFTSKYTYYAEIHFADSLIRLRLKI